MCNADVFAFRIMLLCMEKLRVENNKKLIHIYIYNKIFKKAEIISKLYNQVINIEKFGINESQSMQRLVFLNRIGKKFTWHAFHVLI